MRGLDRETLVNGINRSRNIESVYFQPRDWKSTNEQDNESGESNPDQPLLLSFIIRDSIISKKSLVGVDPKYRLELARIIPMNETVIPLLWVDVEDNVIDNVNNSPVVHSARKFLTVPGRILVEVEWTREFQNWIESISLNGLYLLSAISEADTKQWSCTGWIRSRKNVPDFYEQITNRDLEITVNEQYQYPDNKTA